MSLLTQTPPPRGTSKTGLLNPLAALFAISVVGLFLELLLIRWVSTEIRIFAYLQNTVLVVCFLGLGMGCWDCRKPFVLRHMLLPLLTLAGLLAMPPTRLMLGSISELLGGFGGLVIWGGKEAIGWKTVGAPMFGLLLTVGLMILLWDIFVPVGRLLGKLLADHPKPLKAYSVNVVGSLIGIWAFVACSAMDLPPVAWFAAFALGCLPFVGAGSLNKIWDFLLLGLIVACGWMAGQEPGWQETRWSPYQKLSILNLNNPEAPASFWNKYGGERAPSRMDIGTYFVSVNNIGYQAMIDLSPAGITNDKVNFPPEQRGFSQYDLPAKLHPSPKRGLIVGAGSGNDAAGMLRNGVEQVTAVEIDPAIITLGRRLHPERPYDDSRVTIVNDDARSFFATTNEKFDVIAFGLLDSHTTTAMTNARLDHYVYTRESLTRAKSLLNPDGIIVLSFAAEQPFIADRMARALTEVFGETPLVFEVPVNGYGWGGIVFVAGNITAVRNQVNKDPKFATLIQKWETAMPFALPMTTEVPTDDWPYLYLQTRSIPVLYLLLAGLLAVLFARGLWKLGAGAAVRGWDQTQTHFAFLGAAFMLLEVQNISKASVVLGNTWSVNAVVISGILCMILIANFLASRFPKLGAGWSTVGILAACVVLYWVDLAAFGFLPYPLKVLVVGGLVSLPMLFSGVVFARSFVLAPRKDAALGANLLGSLAGGVLQSITFVVGIKALLLIVAGLYLAAWLTRPRTTATQARRTVEQTTTVQSGVLPSDTPAVLVTVP